MVFQRRLVHRKQLGRADKEALPDLRRENIFNILFIRFLVLDAPRLDKVNMANQSFARLVEAGDDAAPMMETEVSGRVWYILGQLIVGRFITLHTF